MNLLTPKQVAERLGVSDSLVYGWCAAGTLPHYRFGGTGKRGRIMIDEKDCEAFLAACRQAAAQAAVPPLKHIRLSQGETTGKP